MKNILTENKLVKNLRAYPVLHKRWCDYVKGVRELPEGFTEEKLFHDYLKVRRSNPEKRVSMSEYMIFGFYGLTTAQQKQYLTDVEATLLMRPYNSAAEPYLKSKVTFLKNFTQFVSRGWLYLPESDLAAFDAFVRRYHSIALKPQYSSWGIGFRKLTEAEWDAAPDRQALFDELCAGTDPAEGAALAISLIEFCRKCGSKIAATTHYAELKLYAMRTNGVINASCEFNVETLQPTYRLLIGIPGKSNAFAISKKLGLDDAILEDARSMVSQNDVNFEDVLNQLEQQRQHEQCVARPYIPVCQRQKPMQKAAAVEIHKHALRASRIHGAFCVPECRAHSCHDLHTPQDRKAERIANAAPKEDAALRYPQPPQRIAVPAV